MFRFSAKWLWNFMRAGYVAVLGELLYIAHMAASCLPCGTLGDASLLGSIPEMTETLAAASMLLTAGCAVGLSLLAEKKDRR